MKKSKYLFHFRFRIILLVGLWNLCGNFNFAQSSVDFPAFKEQNVKTDQQKFWESLISLCGHSYEGKLLSAPLNDTVFVGKKLVMHVRKYSDHEIKIPFFIGNDKSRTWILTKTDKGILLKHDHRHEDGSPDKMTMYGGHTSHSGNENLQIFPADEETIRLLPAAVGNVWWIELFFEKTFTYNLRRVNTDRFFSVGFDLTKKISQPEAPWGWTDQNILNPEKK